MASDDSPNDDTANEISSENNTAIAMEESEEKGIIQATDHVILWPPALVAAPVDRSRKYDQPKEEREKLAAALLEARDNDKYSRVVVLTGETCHYRSAARVAPLESRGLEIGCAYGDCLAILAKRCVSAVGIDKSVECIDRARERYPNLKMDVLDCFVELEALESIVCDVTVCCVDIGGDRHAEAVFDLINNALRDVPILIIKARILYNSAVKIEDEGLEEWWLASRRTGGSEFDFPRWTKQKKQRKPKEAKANSNKGT